MNVRNHKNFIPALTTILLIVAVCASIAFTGAKAAPLSAEEALEQLAASVAHSDGRVNFKIPEGYKDAEKWNIHIAGRLVSYDFSSSIHFMEDLNGARAWEPGKIYTLPVDDSYAELTLTAFLPGENGETLEKSIDLLNPSAPVVSYGLMQLGASGKVLRTVSPLEGENKQLAEDVIMNYMIRSAAWPGVDVSTLEACWLLRATYSGGTTADYYAFKHDGYPVLQSGKDGMYARIDDGLYEKLTALPDALSAIGNADALRATADRTNLDISVSSAILAAKAVEYRTRDFPTEAHTVLKTVESGSTVTVYAMVLYLRFDYAGHAFSETSGSHMPVAITFEKNAAGEYTLKEYWIPRDGSLFAPSIKGKFPADIHEDAIDTQKYILANMQDCYAQAIKHWGVPVDEHLDKLVEVICSSPAEASNPRAYIDAHPGEYRKLLYFGDYTLRYAFSKFLRGGQTGLEGHIMLAAMRELLGGEDPGGLVTVTAQDWFDKWKEHAVQLRDANSREFMKKSYPKTSILLDITG